MFQSKGMDAATSFAEHSVDAALATCQDGKLGVSFVHQWRFDEESLWCLGLLINHISIFNHVLWVMDLNSSHCSVTLMMLDLVRSGASAQSSTILGICQSVVQSGFRREETVVSRSCSVGTCQLLCGDGMKRVLACKLVSLWWALVVLFSTCILECFYCGCTWWHVPYHYHVSSVMFYVSLKPLHSTESVAPLTLEPLSLC